MDRFEIPRALRGAVRESWAARHADLAGRFDLLYDGVHPPKMLELNGDTPTVLVEAARAQAQWARAATGRLIGGYS